MGFWDGPIGTWIQSEWNDVKRVPFTLFAVAVAAAAFGYWFKSELASSKIDGLEQLVANLQAGVPLTASPASSPLVVFPSVSAGFVATLSGALVIVALLAWRNGRKITSLRSDLATKDAKVNEVQQQLVVAERREADAPEVTVFLHTSGESELASRVLREFEMAGWRVAARQTELPQHASGVRIIGGSQRGRLVASWAMARLGITPIMDVEQRAPGLQVVIGEAQPITIDDAMEQTVQMKVERDAALVALKERRHEYAMEALEACSKLMWPDKGQPHVTVCFAAYGEDYRIATKIKEVISNHVHWKVDLNGSNVPALPQAEKYKVVFDFGLTHFTYQPLFRAFREGEFLGEGVTVAYTTLTERPDPEHVIVRVLPSPQSTSVKQSIRLTSLWD